MVLKVKAKSYKVKSKKSKSKKRNSLKNKKGGGWGFGTLKKKGPIPANGFGAVNEVAKGKGKTLKPGKNKVDAPDHLWVPGTSPDTQINSVPNRMRSAPPLPHRLPIVPETKVPLQRVVSEELQEQKEMVKLAKKTRRQNKLKPSQPYEFNTFNA